MLRDNVNWRVGEYANYSLDVCLQYGCGKGKVGRADIIYANII